MIAKGPVSVNRQTVFSVIPILAIWATYRIQKARIFLLIFWLGFGTIGIARDVAILGVDNFWGSDLIQDLGDPVYAASFIVFGVVEFGLRAYLVRKWSKKWNGVKGFT